MHVHFELHDTYRFYCVDCKDHTSHFHKFYIKKEGRYIALKQCKTCGLETGNEILEEMTAGQKLAWEEIKKNRHEKS